MNRLYLYSIYDKKAGVYYAPLSFATFDDLAKAIKIVSVGKEWSTASDYDIYRVGSFLPANGKVSAETPFFCGCCEWIIKNYTR